MISRLGSLLAGVFRKTCPDPFVIAILLTFVTMILCLTLAPPPLPPAEGVEAQSAMHRLITSWVANDGMWKLLEFAMQMCLILITGHALASSRAVTHLIERIAGMPRSAYGAVFLTAFVAGACAVINWGLGLIVGALLAREVGRAMTQKGVRVHYPLLAAAGYFGLMVWHGGLSGSAPLSASTAAGLTKVLPGDLAGQLDRIPLNTTVGSGMNCVITGGLLIFGPLLFMLLHPRDDAQSTNGSGHANEISLFSSFDVPGVEPVAAGDRTIAEVDDDEARSQSSSSRVALTIPDRLDRSPILMFLLLAPLAVGWLWRVEASGFAAIGLNDVIMGMLILGMAMHGTPRRYVQAVNEAVTGCGGIILQFPIYAGIMGMMSGTHLTETMAQSLASTTNQTTLPVMTFLSAGVVNLFVPSGGGQWAVQGPIVMKAALETGVAPAKMLMALAYGDQLTNMLQPFWALPLLAITGVRARDIVGYTAIVMIAAAVWIGVWLLIF